MPTILDGLRVLDFGRYIAGPFCAAVLGDYGAEVIRIERVGGDDDRYLMPVTAEGEGSLYLQVNRNKRSLTLDISSEQGRAVVRRLVEASDIVVANFAPEVLRKLGLDYETLKSIKPDIILATASAYGSGAEDGNRNGFDGVGQAVSGALYLTGRPGEHYRSAVSYVDYATGLACATGTLAAVIARMKTGQGSVVEGSLVGSALTMMNPILIEEALGVRSRGPTGNRSPIAGPSDVFETTDDPIIVQVIGNGMFRRWARLVERSDLIDDPRFIDDIGRGEHGEALSRVMAAWCAARSSAECLELLGEARIPGSRVLSPAQTLEPGNGMTESFFDWLAYPGVSGEVPVAKPPFSVSAPPGSPTRRAPRLGEHTDEILAEFGYSPQQVAELRSSGIV